MRALISALVLAIPGFGWDGMGPQARAVGAAAATRFVTGQLPAPPQAGRADDASAPAGVIDQHLFAAMAAARVAPAPASTDIEFLRRVSLDLTGRIPSAARVRAFSQDSSGGKRARLVDELLASPEWVDKWTMYYGDLFKNSANFGRQRFPQERQAMFEWIKRALEENRPYDQMARELITASGDDSWRDGSLGLLSRAGMLNQIEQDRQDQQAANVAEVFLGISHLDCLLCHSGRRHLDTVSLWGSQQTRFEAWGMAAFFGKTDTALVTIGPMGRPTPSPWYVRDDDGKAGYLAVTTDGDRPARFGGVVEPRYLFSGAAPKPGENYRAALARELTADLQFARAAVNYLWKEFFVVGLVEPVSQFDPARLDPDHPPPAPWTLQPANARLLNGLAEEFAASQFDVKALMRQIVLSRAYQLSSFYEGEYRDEWEPLYARKYVRRLWAEEIHDAIVLSSGKPSAYWAMQLPGGPAVGGPGGGGANNANRDPVATFLDSFLRGNRFDQLRSGEFTLEQALRLMNNPFVLDRVAVSEGRLNYTDELLVDDLFLSVLSRPATVQEKAAALAMLQTGNRTDQASNLLWTLYNKTDFIFNY